MAFLVLEGTDNFPVTVAVMVGVVIASTIVRLSFGYSFSTWRFHQRGIGIRGAHDIGWLADLTVARLMRAEADKLGYTRTFTIYDESDSLRLVKRVADELEIDTKRFAPRGLRRQISDAKNHLLDAAGYRETVSSFFEQTAADVYDLYEKRIHTMNAMDFDDLLLRSVNLFELYPDVRRSC